MNPIRFGLLDRHMFGIHHRPSAQPRHHAVLLCNPFGQEALRCHRLFRVLADQLARHGFHVLRFDYFGTGDSAGDDGDGDIAAWCENVLAADAELRQHSACARMSWFGLRLGASIAALASVKSPHAVQRIVVWDPVLDGPGYLKQLAQAHLDALRSSFGSRWFIEPALRLRASREAQSEALGFALPQLLQAQIAALSPRTLAAAETGHIALLADPELAGLALFKQQVHHMGKSVSIGRSGPSVNWASNEAMASSIVPAASIKAVIALLKEE